MSALDKVLKAAGYTVPAAPPDPRAEATALVSLAATVGAEVGLTAEDIAVMALANVKEDTKKDAGGQTAGGDNDGDSDEDDDLDVTKDPLYKKLTAKGMPPKAAAATVKRRNAMKDKGDD